MATSNDTSASNLQTEVKGNLFTLIFDGRYSPYFLGIVICQIALWWVYGELDRNIFSLVLTAAGCLLWEWLSPWKE